MKRFIQIALLLIGAVIAVRIDLEIIGYLLPIVGVTRLAIAVLLLIGLWTAMWLIYLITSGNEEGQADE